MHDEQDRLRQRILCAIDPVLRAAGVDAHEVTCEVHGGLDRLEVVLRAPAGASIVRQAIGVRVVDAVRRGDRTVGTVTVDYRFGTKVPNQTDARPCPSPPAPTTIGP